MQISEAKKLKVGDRVTWTPEKGDVDPVSHGTVVDAGYLGIAIRYDDEVEISYRFKDNGRFFGKLSRERKAA